MLAPVMRSWVGSFHTLVSNRLLERLSGERKVDSENFNAFV